jgi:hypothetical protein
MYFTPTEERMGHTVAILLFGKQIFDSSGQSQQDKVPNHNKCAK